MARTPADVRLFFEALDRRAAEREPAERIAICPDLHVRALEPGIQRAFDARRRARSTRSRSASTRAERLYPDVRRDPERRGRARARRALPRAPRRVRRRRRARGSTSRARSRSPTTPRRPSSASGSAPSFARLFTQCRPAADADRRPSRRSRSSADLAGLPRRRAALHGPAGPRRPADVRGARRLRRPRPAGRRAAHRPAAQRGPRARRRRARCSARQHRRGRDPRRPGDLRDPHPDLVHEAPAPVLARLERADDRVLRRPRRARSRACSASRRSSRRARTPRQMRRCSQTPPSRRQSSQPATSSGSSVISIVSRCEQRVISSLHRGAARRGRPCRPSPVSNVSRAAVALLDDAPRGVQPHARCRCPGPWW